MSRIRFDNVSKSYRRQKVLDDVVVEVESQTLTVLDGPSRAGKSVLLRVLVGLDQPDAGRILFDETDITALPAAARTIGYVPQSFALFPHMSVFDNIAYPLVLQGVSGGEIRSRVGQVAEMLRITSLLAQTRAELSGGEKQRTAIARGTLKNASIFVLDDPLAGLDFKLRESLMDDLKDMRAELGATFLYATSDPLEALTVAERLIVLDAGRIVETGTVEDIYYAPAHLRTAEAGGLPALQRAARPAGRNDLRHRARPLRFGRRAAAGARRCHRHPAGARRLHPQRQGAWARHPRHRQHPADGKSGGREHRVSGRAGGTPGHHAADAGSAGAGRWFAVPLRHPARSDHGVRCGERRAHRQRHGRWPCLTSASNTSPAASAPRSR